MSKNKTIKKLTGKGERFTCPKCDTTDISGDGIDPESLSQEVVCNQCGLKWVEYYRSGRWEEVE